MSESRHQAQTRAVITAALQQQASDIHIEPLASGYEIRFRTDGLLQTADTLTLEDGRGLVNCLMVMAQLLTYRLDIPQEGRLAVGDPPLDLRLSIMPTTHGLRAVLRLPAEISAKQSLDQLHLPPASLDLIKQFAAGHEGMLLVTGPAGSGKTTTIYALLSHIAQTSPGLSLISLEDPVERDLPKVTQIQVQPFGELTYERALRSILRQDPQVLMLGEIRDRATAALAIGAALSGHRLIATFHAGTPGGAIARLLEMGVEPYQITSAVFGVVAQRLVRASDGAGNYRGRLPVAQAARMDAALRKAVLNRQDARDLDMVIAEQPGFESWQSSGKHLVDQGLTDASEILRVFGAISGG